jgi:hypothetical protein
MPNDYTVLTTPDLAVAVTLNATGGEMTMEVIPPEYTDASLHSGGWRLRSIDVYGQPPHTRYAAIWVKQDGPPWRAAFDMDAQAYVISREALAAEGFHQVMLCATGSGENVRYAHVCEQRPDVDGKPATLSIGAQYGWASFWEICETYKTEYDMAVRWITAYGSAANPVFNAVVERFNRPYAVSWSVEHADNDTDCIKLLDAYETG